MLMVEFICGNTMLIRTYFLFAALVVSLILATESMALEVVIEKDKISILANQVPLQDILKRITQYDISIRIDPEINPMITVSFANRDLQTGFKSLLKSLNHILIWEPAGQLTSDLSPPEFKLVEVQVFKPGRKDAMVSLQEEPQGLPAAVVETSEMAETDIIIKGNKIYVPVTLAYEETEVETTLVLDTGAGSVVIHQDIANQLGIVDYYRSRGIGVGGIEIETSVTKLRYIRVGPHKKENLRADIIEYNGPKNKYYNGLLGMNFLKNYEYIIDFKNQKLIWNP